MTHVCNEPGKDESDCAACAAEEIESAAEEIEELLNGEPGIASAALFERNAALARVLARRECALIRYVRIADAMLEDEIDKLEGHIDVVEKGHER